MSVAPWRSPLSQSLHENRSLAYSRYLQLATVQVNGHPANRTLVFRGFLEDSEQLKFVIDARSQKPDQINYQPWAEACWYFPETREQFRIFGSLTLVKADELNTALDQARQTTWQELSDAARSQFAWPDPGKPKADPAAFKPPPPNPNEPLENFCLLLLQPVQIDHLQLRSDPQNRTIYSWHDDKQAWSTQAINP